MKSENNTEIPYIFTVNTYFWKPSCNSRERRANELRRYSEAKSYFESWGFKYNGNTRMYELQNASNFIEVEFHYSESCNNIYKSLKIFKNGKKSNITTLKRLQTKGEIRKNKIENILNNG